MGTWLSDDLEGALVSGGELLRQSGCAEVLSLNKDFVSNFQNRRRKSTGIGRTLIALLSLEDIFSENLVEFIEVSYKIVGTRGSDIPVGMHGNCEVVTLIGVERGNTCGGVRRVVIGEFRKQKQRASIVLLVITVSAEILFECLIDSFSLTVSFGMITRGEMDTHV